MVVVKDEVNFRVNLSYGDSFINDDATTSEEVREGMYLQFIFWGILVPFIASFGFVGNTLTMFVLFRREMRSTTIYYLRALVITDSSILLVAVAVLTPFSIAEISADFKYYKDVVYPLIFTYLNYATMAVQTCNVWITVSVSVERYIAICHPFIAPRITTNRTTLIVIGLVTAFSIFYNLPRIFATASRKCAEGDCYELYTTDFGKTDGYKVAFQVWMYVIVMFVIPLTALFVLNILIIMELMRMARRRRGTNIQNDDEANLSLVLVLIVVVFIICQTPGLIAQFEIFSFPVFLKLLAVSNTLFVLNSSVNFLIYTFVGRRFRKVLIKRVFFRCVKTESLSFNNFTSNHTHAYELTRVNDNV
ncbi:FMRFamide receptor-like [Liolophura sinensis]|uniref:FMRFamide receptor-like n=1 Tax=Liolophura sinensis TaxID=3198878 RepID=UPI003158DB7D